MVMIGNSGVKGAGSFAGQGFRVEFERPSPGPYEALRDEAIAIRGASVDAVYATTEEVKERIRDYIDAHFSGSEVHSNNRRRVSNASAQSTYYDDIDGKGQYAGLVYSKFGKRDAGGFVDFLLLHVRGGTIKARNGDWLRLVNEKAGGTAGVAAQTGYFKLSDSDIFFRPSKDGKKLFQLRRYRKSSTGPNRGRTVLLATLFKELTVSARLTGIDEIARSRADLFEGYFAEAVGVRRMMQGVQ